VFALACNALGLRAWWLAPLLWCGFIGLSMVLNLLSRNDLRAVLQR
jgi:hypothetical protein